MSHAGKGTATLATVLALAAVVPLAQAAPAKSARPVEHRVTFDGHSFMIDGQRTYLWSGEFHPYRLPSPELWPDIFQKMKAAGFNTVSVYFSWGYHSPKQGVYDFSGIRDIDRMLDDAQAAGIYVIARPGPYINAEVDSGGFPLWLTTQDIRNRSPDPAYLALADEWLSKIDAIIARHQITQGKGTVIAYQVENEYYKGTDAGRDYMQHLEDKARADGITVPLVGNHNATFVTGKGAVDVSGWDYYPQGFDCSHPEIWNAAPDMAAHKFAGEPLFTAEFQGGAFDPWGGPGYAKCAQLINDRFANVFYKQNVAAGATAQNFYMLFGGTSWGWQAIPQNYTSYDYGSAITEARQFDPKYYEDKRIGYFVTHTPALLKTDTAPPARLDNPALIDVARVNPDTGTQFHLVRQGDSTATGIQSGHIALTLKEGHFAHVPQAPGTTITLDGRDTRMVVADLAIGANRLVYSTSEVMTSGTIGPRDVAVLYGRPGTDGETVLAFARKPDVKVLSGDVQSQWSKGMLRLNYRHNGLARVQIGGGPRPLLLLLADTPATERIWQQDTARGAVLMIGSHLLRSARYTGDTLALTGDGDQDSAAQVLAAPLSRITWNGVQVSTHITPDGAHAFAVPTPAPVTLPALQNWTARSGAPEIAPGFDDKGWPIADRATSVSVTKPGSLPVLFADDYGFHTGNTWYRGHFSGSGAAVPSGIRLSVKSGGVGGAFSAWLNGHFLGTVSRSELGAFSFPEQFLVKGDNVLSVLTVNMGHEEDYDSKNENRTARGIVSAVPTGAPGSAITWRLQGATSTADALRGPYNLGGLFGERQGWYDNRQNAGWSATALPVKGGAAGVTWYRTQVALDLPRGQDTSLGLAIQDAPGAHYRATLFVNGWQMGNYVAGLGPQSRFPVPSGIIHPHGQNTVTIAVWKTQDSGGSLGKVSLINYGTVTSPLVIP